MQHLHGQGQHLTMIHALKVEEQLRIGRRVGQQLGHPYRVGLKGLAVHLLQGSRQAAVRVRRGRKQLVQMVQLSLPKVANQGLEQRPELFLVRQDLVHQQADVARHQVGHGAERSVPHILLVHGEGLDLLEQAAKRGRDLEPLLAERGNMVQEILRVGQQCLQGFLQCCLVSCFRLRWVDMQRARTKRWSTLVCLRFSRFFGSTGRFRLGTLVERATQRIELVQGQAFRFGKHR